MAASTGRKVVELVAVLAVASVALVVALVLLTGALVRLRGTANQLQKALAEESGARDRAGLLLTVASAVNSSLALEEVLNVALTHAGRIMGAVAGAMYLVTPSKAEMRRQADYNLTHHARGGVRQLDDEPLRSVLTALRPLVLPLAEENAPGLEGGGHPQFVLVVPIQRSGQLMGAFELYLRGAMELREDQIDLLTGVASQAAIAIRHAQLYIAQENNALTDELTKLPNRRYMAQRFLQEMQRARRSRKSLAFMMIDIDHFKNINDTYGHLHGDAVLAELAKILNAGKRETDVCARYGGEEFGLILNETPEAGAVTLAERIRSKIAGATFPGGLKLTISVGVAASSDPAMFTSLIDRADQALYAAKQAGRNQVKVADLKTSPAKQHA
jgi:diguanylate cyclase (GGDEF)-like protein